MGDEKVLELLLQLVQDMSYVKTKITAIEEKKLSSRIDKLEAQVKEHDKTIKSLENRNSTMEEFTRNNLNESRKQHVGLLISLGLAVFSAVLSFIIAIIQYAIL